MNNMQMDEQDEIKAIIKSATMQFSEYSCLTEAIKKQKESIIKFGDLQKDRSNFSVSQNRGDVEQVEALNKQKVCDYFKILKDLDNYIGQKDQYKITYSRYALQEASESPRKIENTVYRRKCIIIEDSYRNKIGSCKNQSKVLTCRNPFKADEVLIDYDMDSEDEWAEENGEEINDDNEKSDDDDEEAGDQEEVQGFIVDDDYLSVSEMNYSNISSKDQNEIKADIQRKK